MKPIEPIDSKYTFALISNLTHQAINPLNGVIGTLDNIIKKDISGDKVDQRLRSAKSQLEYTISLIRNLAFFTEYGLNDNDNDNDNGSGRTSKISVIPQNLIEAAQFFQEQAKNRGIYLNIESRKIPNAIYGDPDLLRQVFMNIFDNFVKYSDDNTTVLVEHHIQTRTNDIIIKFQGTTSVGFDDSDKIFEFGARGKSAVKKTSSGSGLGLHICKIILEKVFNGSIEAQYTSKRSLAVFTIRIPNAFLKKDHFQFY